MFKCMDLNALLSSLEDIDYHNDYSDYLDDKYKEEHIEEYIDSDAYSDMDLAKIYNGTWEYDTDDIERLYSDEDIWNELVRRDGPLDTALGKRFNNMDDWGSSNNNYSQFEYWELRDAWLKWAEEELKNTKDPKYINNIKADIEKIKKEMSHKKK